MIADYNLLLDNYLTEAEKKLDDAENKILLLEQSSEKDLASNIIQTFHAIKIDSGILGFQKIVDLLKALEDAIKLVLTGKINLSLEKIDVFLIGLDRLRHMIKNINQIYQNLRHVHRLILKAHNRLSRGGGMKSTHTVFTNIHRGH